MVGRLRPRLATTAARPHLPRGTVRLRLTLLYGAMFLVSGALVLGLTFGLVDRTTRDDPVTITLANGATVSADRSGRLEGEPDQGTAADESVSQPNDPGGEEPTPEPNLPSTEELAQLASQQHATRMHELLVQSGIALGAMTVVSVALGWIVAGRVLRPLRTITAAARDISATNLHARLGLRGPADELKELGDTFDDLLARLERSFEAQRRFIANASHELRTPLARQRTLAQIAIDDPDATVDSLRAAHKRVLAAGVEQDRLIEALLTLARGQTGLVQRQDLDLASPAGRVLMAKQTEAKRRGLELGAELAPAAAAGDPRLIERLVTNLLDNALRYNCPGGSVRITTDTRTGQPVLSVTNTGPVVSPDAVDQLFQPFQRLATDRTSRGDGLGLGLSIVQAITDAHGAIISAHPQPNGGLLIEVTFPAASEAARIGDHPPVVVTARL
jgi:signal transduction histidine kinase